MTPAPSASGGARARRSARRRAAAAPDHVDVEVVADRTKGSKADEGFLRVRRLTVRSVFADGTRSAPYPCDIVSRSRTDAVAVVLYELERATRGPRVLVALKTGVRPPVILRRHLPLTQPDDAPYGRLAEIVAGMLEPEDTGRTGIARRAVAECHEEAGVRARVGDVAPLGAASFPSPGVTDEKVHFRAVATRLDRRGVPAGDGSAMEAGTTVWVLPVEDAIAACRAGTIPDMKTELALVRLCDAIGYLPGLRTFVADLPAPLRRRWRALGLAPPRKRAP